jgi:hypothetical protein
MGMHTLLTQHFTATLPLLILSSPVNADMPSTGLRATILLIRK